VPHIPSCSSEHTFCAARGGTTRHSATLRVVQDMPNATICTRRASISGGMPSHAGDPGYPWVCPHTANVLNKVASRRQMDSGGVPICEVPNRSTVSQCLFCGRLGRDPRDSERGHSAGRARPRNPPKLAGPRPEGAGAGLHACTHRAAGKWEDRLIGVPRRWTLSGQFTDMRRNNHR
jgi:hypothetical protein